MDTEKGLCCERDTYLMSGPHEFQICQQTQNEEPGRWNLHHHDISISNRVILHPSSLHAQTLVWIVGKTNHSK